MFELEGGPARCRCAELRDLHAHIATQFWNPLPDAWRVYLLECWLQEAGAEIEAL
jgi:hypothetical protein